MNRASAVLTLLIVVAGVLGYAAGWFSFGRDTSTETSYEGVVGIFNIGVRAGCIPPATGGSGDEWCGLLTGQAFLLEHLTRGQRVHVTRSKIAGETVLLVTP